MNFKEVVKKYINYDLSEYQLQQFEIYYEFLIDYNKKVNLTRIVEQEEVYIKHFLDSILVNNLIDFTKINSLIDMGSGAGFPGVPLKILYPHLEVVLVDARKKKLLFLEKLFKKLNLTKIKTIHERLEKLKFDKHFDLATARALSSLDMISNYAYPILKKGGYIVSYKSQNYEEEMTDFNKKWEAKIKVEKIDYRELPKAAGTRYNILLKKIK